VEDANWIFSGIYAEKVTGTDFSKRVEFNRMIKDAKAGKIDLILTKSVARFGRNTLPFLQSINEFSRCGVAVRFCLENISTDEPDVSGMIAIHAAIAQAESENKSWDIKWGIRHNFEKGKVQLNHSQFLGYTKCADGRLVIVEEEAEVVRLIFDLYLKGNGCRKIKKYLEEHGIKTVTGKDIWSTATIDRMLSNEKYAGIALLQKSYVADPLSHRQMKNDGELPMYLVDNSHEAIICPEVFEAVQRRKHSEKAT
jgi:site-specific DNA recombinase